MGAVDKVCIASAAVLGWREGAGLEGNRCRLNLALLRAHPDSARVQTVGLQACFI